MRERKRVILTRSVFRTHKTDRGSLSCIVMQRAKNDSDAFFMFTLVFRFRGYVQAGVMVNGSVLREGSTGFVVGGSVSD
ncbi:hypothetical protein DLU56_23310 [Escherichia coli]|nr:hypothetical protein [Escherichia coli]EFO0236055.1 hypothetical protein [Escherichia coli]EFO4223437.1 hypothetical protein [Escherichia coli]EGD7754610.1 hypothetical protein [Escherichia coli]EGE0690914.1 hypothetical protein [Escherichia coli]